jgi:hypothetical protein
VKDRRGQSSRTQDKEDLQPNDRGTPSRKYAPALASINVNLAATIKNGKREFPSLPWSLGNKKIRPRISPRLDLYTARGVHPPVPQSTVHFTYLKGWFDVCHLGAVLGFDNYASSSSRICGLS